MNVRRSIDPTDLVGEGGRPTIPNAPYPSCAAPRGAAPADPPRGRSAQGRHEPAAWGRTLVEGLEDFRAFQVVALVKALAAVATDTRWPGASLTPPVRDIARPPRWVGRARSVAGQLPFGQQLGMSLLTEIASRGTNAVLPFGVAVWLMRNQ